MTTYDVPAHRLSSFIGHRIQITPGRWETITAVTNTDARNGQADVRTAERSSVVRLGDVDYRVKVA